MSRGRCVRRFLAARVPFTRLVVLLLTTSFWIDSMDGQPGIRQEFKDTNGAMSSAVHISASVEAVRRETGSAWVSLRPVVASKIKGLNTNCALDSCLRRLCLWLMQLKDTISLIR
jgi:hypothetical protein